MTEPVGHVSELLAGHRDKLQAIEGVVGSGVGLTRSGVVGIQLFVGSEQDVANAEREARALLGDIPLEVVVSGDVTAADLEQGGEHA